MRLKDVVWAVFFFRAREMPDEELTEDWPESPWFQAGDEWLLANPTP